MTASLIIFHDLILFDCRGLRFQLRTIDVVRGSRMHRVKSVDFCSIFIGAVEMDDYVARCCCICNKCVRPGVFASFKRSLFRQLVIN